MRVIGVKIRSKGKDIELGITSYSNMNEYDVKKRIQGILSPSDTLVYSQLFYDDTFHAGKWWRGAE